MLPPPPPPSNVTRAPAVVTTSGNSAIEVCSPKSGSSGDGATPTSVGGSAPSKPSILKKSPSRDWDNEDAGPERMTSFDGQSKSSSKKRVNFQAFAQMVEPIRPGGRRLPQEQQSKMQAQVEAKKQAEEDSQILWHLMPGAH
mmetsp:Transcript_56258/g.159497  ORF Transcript_56258/g.159497 Transcript_56258/m.159497 type:complete len:142 (-) Transcript_56258:169-594(-)